MRRLLLLTFLLLGIGCSGDVLLAAAPVDQGDEPIHIEADRMISREDKNSVVFLGHVDARQGDLVIRSDEMTVYYESQDGAADKVSTSRVRKLVCKGNVEISRGDWLGTGRRMDYFADERKAVLTGDAKAWKGQNMVTGQTIIYFLDEGRSIVENGPRTSGRVRAVIRPDQDRSGAGKPPSPPRAEAAEGQTTIRIEPVARKRRQ